MWTIAQAALNEKDPLRMGVLMMFWLESNIMASIPFFTVNRLGISMTRQVRTSLTKPGWVAIGEAYGKSTAQLEQVEETVFKLGFVFLMAVVAFVLYNDISKLTG